MPSIYSRILICSFLLLGINSSTLTQEDSLKWLRLDERIFSTYLEIGVVAELSDQLEGGRFMKSAFEFRMKGRHHLFFRGNYDQYSSTYKVKAEEAAEIVLDNHANMSDVILGPGYRFGKNAHRFTLLYQAGIKYYSKAAILPGLNKKVLFMEEGYSIFTHRLSTGIEYYFGPTFSITLEAFHNMVGKRKDYWTERKGSLGLTLGLQGTFF
ncbi:MAG: hypothetical protein AAF696_24585 [Bacteroidota bacterium]